MNTGVHQDVKEREIFNVLFIHETPQSFNFFPLPRVVADGRSSEETPTEEREGHQATRSAAPRRARHNGASTRAREGHTEEWRRCVR